MKSKIITLTILLLLIFNLSSAQIISSLIRSAAENKKEKNLIKKNHELVSNAKDEGITGSNHEKYNGKIVFDTTRIERSKMNLPNKIYRNEFRNNEFVYGRAFLPKAVVKYLINEGKSINQDKRGEIYYHYLISALYIDGKIIDENSGSGINYFSVEAADKQTGLYITTFDVDVFKNKKDGGTNYNVVNKINSLSPGKHIIKVEVYGGQGFGETFRTKDPIVSGEFTVVVDGKSKQQYGKTFDMLEEEQKDDAITNDMIKACNASNEKSYNNPLGVKITSRWDYVRNPKTSIIIQRQIHGYLYYKLKDGTCGFCEGVFYQNYNGNGYDKLIFDSAGRWEPLDCME